MEGIVSVSKNGNRFFSIKESVADCTVADAGPFVFFDSGDFRRVPLGTGRQNDGIAVMNLVFGMYIKVDVYKRQSQHHKKDGKKQTRFSVIF